MAFALFLCGPSVGELASAAPALVEELATRQTTARVLSDVASEAEGVTAAPGDELTRLLESTLAEGVSAVVLLSDPSSGTRDALVRRFADSVVVDWGVCGDFQSSESAHLALGADVAPIDGLGQVFELLEGLGYVAFAEQGALSPEQDAELVARLKDLGYV